MMIKKIPKFWISLFFRKVKLTILRVYRAQGNSHEIALGAAIGAFWGVFPTFGLSTVLIFILYRFIRFNIITAFAGAFVSNPLTSPFLLLFSYQIGALFITGTSTFDLEDWFRNLQDLGATMLIGSTILSSFTAGLVYLITFYVIEHRHSAKKLAKVDSKICE